MKFPPASKVSEGTTAQADCCCLGHGGGDGGGKLAALRPGPGWWVPMPHGLQSSVGHSPQACPGPPSHLPALRPERPG